MQAGQSCINNVPRWTGWDWSRQRDNPNTVKNELGLECVDPDDEITCPKARRCMSPDELGSSAWCVPKLSLPSATPVVSRARARMRDAYDGVAHRPAC